MITSSLFFPYENTIRDVWSFLSYKLPEKYRTTCAQFLHDHNAKAATPLLNNTDPVAPVSFFVNDEYGGTVDRPRVDAMIKWFIKLKQDNFVIVPTIFCDNPWDENVVRFFDRHPSVFKMICNALDPYVDGYIIGLESSEYLSAEQVNQAVALMKQHTTHLVGTHMAWDYDDLSKLPSAIEFLAHEFPWDPHYGKDHSRAEVVEIAKKVILKSQKRTWFLEDCYPSYDNVAIDHARGLAQIGIGGEGVPAPLN